MPTLTTKDGADLYYKDWGHGQAIVFNHACGLNADAFEDQMFFFATLGYRCMAADRRGHGRSSQTWHGNDIDTYGGALARPSWFRTRSQGGALSFGHAVALANSANPTGTPMEVFDGFRQGVLNNRAQFMKELTNVYFGADQSGSNIPQALLDATWNQEMLTGFPAAYFAIQAFSETDITEDLKKIDVPVLILQGDVDKIVPLGNAHRTAKLISSATLKEYPGAPHALIATHKDQVNQDLLKFITI